MRGACAGLPSPLAVCDPCSAERLSASGWLGSDVGLAVADLVDDEPDQGHRRDENRCTDHDVLERHRAVLATCAGETVLDTVLQLDDAGVSPGTELGGQHDCGPPGSD